MGSKCEVVEPKAEDHLEVKAPAKHHKKEAHGAEHHKEEAHSKYKTEEASEELDKSSSEEGSSASSSEGSEELPADKKLAKREHLRKTFSEKEFEFEEDFFAFTCFCYLRRNEPLFMLNPKKRGQALYSTLLIFAVIISMLVCMLLALVEDV